MRNESKKMLSKLAQIRSNPNIQDHKEKRLEQIGKAKLKWSNWTLTFIFFRQKINVSSINPFFHEIYLSTTTGIKTFKNVIIGLDDEDKYEGIQDSIT